MQWPETKEWTGIVMEAKVHTEQ